MAVEVKWDDTDPNTGGRRYFAAELFAREWHFKVRYHRRDDWQRWRNPTLDMWETVLDSIERRQARKKDVLPEEVERVRKIVERERSRQRGFGQEEE